MASAAPPRHVHIEALRTAQPPSRVEPGLARPVSVAAPPLPAAALQRRARVVLYYRAAADGEPAPWNPEEALLAKESLSETVAEYPEMAGRLRRRADGSWEVKLNDTGIRLVLATVEATVDDFVGGEDTKRWEAALAPWTDVDAEDPDMCALCYVQLTRFQGDGGYAVGVSCSLMLCDPVSLARFLLSWARAHAEMKAQNKLATNPMLQYASYFQRPEIMTRRVKSVPLDAFAAADGDAKKTVLFRAAASCTGADHRALAAACVDEAADAAGKNNKVPRFSLIVVAREGVGDNPRGMSVETCTADDRGLQQAAANGGHKNKLEVAQWKDLGLEEFALRGSKPVHVSCTIVTGGDEGLVVVMPDGKGLLVTVTVPK
ncbi:hypothetical protein U9M48_022566 [Paspalum notatum var. saurae]|uniref:Uncharacterized protein n=1 Tax=Paspalum notatum var. saurae TaxID=547442 RepID=A0AAQ3WUX6_PASNO